MNVLDLFKLNGKSALVTGGAKGLGTAINEGLCETGLSKLIIIGRNRHGQLSEEKKRLNELFSCEILPIACDISKEDQVKALVEKINQNGFSVEILINSAGITWNLPTIDQSIDSWNKVLNTNLTGTFLMCREIANNFMIPQQRGSIINMSSLLALIGNAEISQIGYSASKSAILGLTRQLAVEWANHNIRVNSVIPSFFDGIDSMSKMFTNEQSPVRELLLDMIPLRKFVSPDDLKAVICYLASEASSIMTGQSIILDGGFMVK